MDSRSISGRYGRLVLWAVVLILGLCLTLFFVFGLFGFLLGSQWETRFNGKKLVSAEAYVLKANEKAVPKEALVVWESAPDVSSNPFGAVEDEKLATQLRKDFWSFRPGQHYIDTEVRRFHSMIFVLFFKPEAPFGAPGWWGIWNYEDDHWEVWLIRDFYSTAQ